MVTSLLAPPTQNNSVSSSPFLRPASSHIKAHSFGQGSQECAVHWPVHLITWALASHVRGLALVRRIGGGRSPRLRFPSTAITAILPAYIGSFSYKQRIVLLSRCPRPFYPGNRYLKLGGLLGRKIQLLRGFAWHGCTVCCGGGSIVTVGNTSWLQPRTRLRRQSGRGALWCLYLAPLL